jgi:L-aminopeptidase/D-esterase-like protein
MVNTMPLTRRDFARGLAGGTVSAAWLGGRGAAARETAPDRYAGSLTDVPGIRVGHFTDPRRPTGCTAILFDGPVGAGVDYANSAPGEMLGVALQPVSPIDRIHGMLLTGGGPMGLGAVAGVVRHLESKQVGYDWGVPDVRIPIVVGAVIDDLSVGDGRLRPGPDEAERACVAAGTGPVAQGCVGAGAGATVGKMFRRRGLAGMKGGIGSASFRQGGLVVAALTVVNAAGDIVDWQNGQIVAGARTADGKGFVNSMAVLREGFGAGPQALRLEDEPFRSTTLTVVATNVTLDKTRLTRLAMMTNTGVARAIQPYHTEGDGDQLYALSTNAIARDVSVTEIAGVAAEVAAAAVLNAVMHATSVEGWMAVRDIA